MISPRWLARSRGLICTTVVATAFVAGCSNSSKTAGPADQATLTRVRTEINKSDPQAVVGLVITVEPNGRPFAAVGNVNFGDFHEGEPMTFIDSNRKTLANGIVRRVTEDALHVEWMKPAKGGRAPRAGDLAVRFK